MSLADYFREKKGTGILATANDEGQVNSAIYARPHFFDDSKPDQLALIMRDRLSRNYLNSNPNAFYTFIEKGEGYQGKRLVLKRIKEETDPEKIASVRRRNTPPVCRENEENETLYLVHFDVVEQRPLVGATKR